MFLENTNKGQHRGWIEVVCGCMFSGKTEELIRRMKRAEFARLRVEIFKPQVDTRYSDDEVVSHDKNTIVSTPIDHSSQLLLLTSEIDVVGIDEAQFFDEGLPEVCTQLANSGIRVIVAGLDLDYLGRPFGPMPQLLALAEYVTKVHAICVQTGNHAHHSYRITDSNSLVELGEKDSYVPLSREAFVKAMEKKSAGTASELDLKLARFVEEVEEKRRQTLERRRLLKQMALEKAGESPDLSES
ncbi:MAG: thymidine kinase [Flavobacteriales bacterium]|nr:thymidine kinase [Flavobacteriales bacterium]